MEPALSGELVLHMPFLACTLLKGLLADGLGAGLERSGHAHRLAGEWAQEVRALLA